MDGSINTKLLSGTLFKAKRYLSRHYDLALVTAVVPLVSVLMWYLGRISPEYQTSFTFRAFTINTLYIGIIVLAVKNIVIVLWQKLKGSKAKKVMMTLVTALVVYLTLHTIILSLVEQKSGVTLLVVLYALGASLVIAMVFLFISKEVSKEPDHFDVFLKVTHQGRSTQLRASEVRLVEMRNQLATVTDKSGKNYLSTQALSTIVETLDSSCFYRINRQQIVNITSIRKWERQANKTYKIWLAGDESPMTVSRSRARVWKALMSTKTAVQK